MIYESIFSQDTKREFLSWQIVALVVESMVPFVSLKERLTAPFAHNGTLMAETVSAKAKKSKMLILFISLKNINFPKILIKIIYLSFH